MSQLRVFLRTLRPAPSVDPVVRFETAMGEQLQVDWVEFRKGTAPLHAFCATLGFSRASYVEFVSDMKVTTLIACHERAFAAFGAVTKRVLYDNMKAVVLERDAYGEGKHRFPAGILDYARHSGFIIKLCRPYRAKTKGKVERFNVSVQPRHLSLDRSRQHARVFPLGDHEHGETRTIHCCNSIKDLAASQFFWAVQA